jgi:anti-anti-sigma regulatory factor
LTLPLEADAEPIRIEACRSGEWMPEEDLRTEALSALQAGGDVTVNLGNLEHLDASALQVLLALAAEQAKLGRKLELANASAHLRQWFEFAGAAERFSMAGPLQAGIGCQE